MDIIIYVISDSLGETAHTIADAIMEQFPDYNYDVVRYPLTKTFEQIDDILLKIGPESIVISTIVIKDLNEYLHKKAEAKGIKSFDALGDEITAIEEILATKSKEIPGANRQLDRKYFETIGAIEFTITHDDGVDPKGIKKADIVLIGVSRTSKTPTSLLLATKGYKVMNVPLVPESKPPKELWEIDSRKIIGLITSVEKLNLLRKDRLKVLGLSHSEYSKENRIKEELIYALEIMDSLRCEIIDVSDKTIHGTANEIEKIIKSKKVGS